MPSSKIDSPFVVRTLQGVLVDHFEVLEQAEASAKERNVRAEAMGIQARYVAKDES